MDTESQLVLWEDTGLSGFTFGEIDRIRRVREVMNAPPEYLTLSPRRILLSDGGRLLVDCERLIDGFWVYIPIVKDGTPVLYNDPVPERRTELAEVVAP